MSQKRRTVTAVVAVVLVIGVEAIAERPGAKSTTGERVQVIATENLGGPVLAIDPHVEYSRALLRVAAPGGAQVTRAFGPEEKIELDLLKAEWAGGKAQPSGKGAAAEPTVDGVLADGRYRYEVRFFHQGAPAGIHTGQFFVTNGSAVSRSAMRDRLSATRREPATPVDQATTKTNRTS